jgi:hypothetical protein
MVIFAPEYEGGMTDGRIITGENVNSVWIGQMTRDILTQC